ncbi:hypothetical protein [Paracoccus sp. PAR01]|uniref:hypothetical protein n=1 Tax=Paracoccus sp. PAR01 TaxID=2769282 RepID=UPI00178654A2|nr:hypothetical protein [Paracoccus sp. PAR01]MBD9528380.1 hypothetical protein [Paracoccus sp. PAR01]
MNLNGQMTLTHKGRVHALTVNFAAICTYEAETGKNGLTMLRLLAQGGVNAGLVSARDIRALFYGGLKTHDPEMTIALAEEIIDTNPDMLLQALGAAMPAEGDTPDPTAKPGKVKRPRGRRAKT